MRPGSIVSNIEQRLDEIEGLGPADIEGLRLEDTPTAAMDEGASAACAAPSSVVAATEAQYLSLLQQMQYRDLTPADLQLLKLIEHQRAERHRSGQTVPIGGPSGGCSREPWSVASSGGAASWGGQASELPSSHTPTTDTNCTRAVGTESGRAGLQLSGADPVRLSHSP